MKRSPIWYACQMFLYELRLAYRAANPPKLKTGTTTTIGVTWEIK